MALLEGEEQAVAHLRKMAAEAAELDTMKCVHGEPMLWLEHERALIPGHIYSHRGIDEARISRCCEYHFDRMFFPGWTDPITGEAGSTPPEGDGNFVLEVDNGL